MKKYLIVLLVIVLILIGAGVAYWKLVKSTSTNPEQVACTEEAKICPDGSAVGRQGPGCEFAECPIAQAVDETADWKTYRNAEWGFAIKYPQAFSLEESKVKKGDSFKGAVVVQVRDLSCKLKLGCGGFGVAVGQPEDNYGKDYNNVLDLAHALYNDERSNYDQKSLKFTEAIVGGEKGVRVTGISISDEGTSNFSLIMFIKDNFLYSVSYRPEGSKLFRGIQDSFSFD